MSAGSARERLRRRQEELGVAAKKSLGQNFLVSDAVIGKILDEARGMRPGSLIEIGPGLGALTDGLRETGAPLTLIELDSVFADYWRGQGEEVIEVDALRWSWELSGFDRPCVLVSNLPYQISSSLVVDRCLDERPLDGMILMFQKEVAQRLKARPGHELYGFLSALAQTFWKIEQVVDAGPREFSPAPKVASRVLSFRPKERPVDDPRRFLKVMKAAFLHPRKYLVSNLGEGLGLPKDEVKERFVRAQWNPQIRADQLAPEKFLELYALFR